VHERAYSEYNALVDTGMRRMNAFGAKGAAPERVAETIWTAATDSSARLRYVVGSDAKGLMFMRRLLPDAAYRRMIRSQLLA
jgi:hypothetical protein